MKYDKKQVRYSKALVKDICDHIARDISVLSLYRNNPDKYPRPETFSRWIQSKPEIRETYETARKLQMVTIDDQYTDLLNCEPPNTGDKIADSHNYKVWQTKLSHYRDRLTRLAPIFNKEYDKVTKTEVKHTDAPNIVVTNYSIPDTDDVTQTSSLINTEDVTKTSKNDDIERHH
jgi:hypothetical protein